MGGSFGTMPIRVLAIDKAEKTLDDYVGYLSDTEYDVAVSTGCDNRSDHIRTEGYDVVVCEIELDGGSGFDLLSAASQRRGEPRFVMTTAERRLESVLTSLKLGASDYLEKPVSQKSLCEAVRVAYADKEDWEKVNIQLGEAGWVELLMPSSVCLQPEHMKSRSSRFDPVSDGSLSRSQLHLMHLKMIESRSSAALLLFSGRIILVSTASGALILTLKIVFPTLI